MSNTDYELVLEDKTTCVTIPDLDSVVFEIAASSVFGSTWLKWSPEFLRDLHATVTLPLNNRFVLVHAGCVYHREGDVLSIATYPNGRDEPAFLRLTVQDLAKIVDMYRAVKVAYRIWREKAAQPAGGDDE